jgi:hypothetical protein
LPGPADSGSGSTSPPTDTMPDESGMGGMGY